ncbi:response regulator [Paenibacillus sp. FSL R7-0333]|uniref:response regulator n=1 Tax=Paenibacillus sp. FSL R7-0333 TaxID=1926587 RepID=UPI00097001C2|nr:hypothetical protein BK146_19345 [Paenibacillus sp. FSL R7-0333]
MIRLLIVDNERWIVRNLLDLFGHWDKLELEVYGAYSAAEALEQLGKMKFDIVLSDIRMPGMDGLELQQEIRRHWPWCKIIFLSGYNEFDYIQQVMRGGGVDYLLKTEGEEAILHAVEQAAAQLDAAVEAEELIERAHRQLQLVRPLLLGDYLLELMQGDSPGVSQLAHKFQELECPLDAARGVLLTIGRVDDWRDELSVADRELMLYAIRNIAEEYWLPSVRCLSLRYEKNKLLWLLQPMADAPEDRESALRFIHGTLETIAMSCKRLLKLRLSFSAGAAFRPWEEAPRQFSTLKALLGRGLGMGKELVLIEQRKEAGEEAQQAELHNHEISSQLGKLGAMAAYLDNGQQEHFFLEFGKLAALASPARGTDNRLKLEIYYSLMCLLLSYMNRWELHEVIGESIDLDKLTRYEAHPSWESAEDYLSALAMQLFEQKQDDQVYREHDLITRVRLYVEHHLAGDLSLTRIGDVVGYNPYYLTRLYKRLTGQSLPDYVASSRLAEARKLLEGGSLIVQDISKAVGFMTEQSFYRFFKKETGITPQEYRERHTLSKSDNQK